MKIKQTPANELKVGDIAFDIDPTFPHPKEEAICFEVINISIEENIMDLKPINGNSGPYIKTGDIVPYWITNQPWYVLEIEPVDVN